jgi:hypothetical protein
MNPIIVASLISSAAVLLSAGVTFLGVVVKLRAQTARIDQENKAALAAQTHELKKQLVRDDG